MPVKTTQSGLWVYEKLHHQPAKATITPIGSSVNKWWPTSMANTTGVDLTMTKWGAAIAYLTVHQIHVCVNIFINQLNQVPWRIVRVNPDEAEEDTVLCSSRDDLPTHDFHQAMRDFRRENGQSLLATMMFDRMVYGQVFLERTGGFFGGRGLEWLNPLGVTLVVERGELTGFRYGWDQQYFTIEPKRIAYNHLRHPFDDYEGYSRVMAAMQKVNIENNLNRFWQDMFKNMAMPFTIMSPADEMVGGMSVDMQQKLEESVRKHYQSIGNQFRTMILPQNLNVEQLQLPNMGDFNTGAFSTAIFEAMGVPQAMAGNTSATPYKDGEETTKRFRNDIIKPEAEEIQQYINAELMPFFDPTNKTRFKFDYSYFETITDADQLEMNIVNGQLQGGYITLATAARRQEQPVEAWMENRYLYDGVPMTIEQINRLVEAKIAAVESQSLSPFGMPSEPSPTPELPSAIDEIEGTDEVIDNEDAIDTAELFEEDEVTKHHPFLRLYNGRSIYPDEATIEARIKDELRQWQNFESKRITGINARTREFTCFVTPSYIKRAVIDVLDAMPDEATEEDVTKAFDYIHQEMRRKGASLKSVSTYRRRLRSLVTQYWNSAISRSDFKVGVSNAIDQQYRLAAQQGVQRGGLAMVDLEPDELELLENAIKEEQSHIDTIADAIEANRKAEGGELAPLRARIDTWTNRWIGISNLFFAIASKGQKLEWVWDARKEHCFTCSRLNGRVYRGSEWKAIGIHPRSPKLACFGIWCGCEFVVTDKPRTRGRLPSFRSLIKCH